MEILVSVGYAEIKPTKYDVLKGVQTPHILMPLTMKGCFLPGWLHVHAAVTVSICGLLEKYPTLFFYANT
jgi:hypothetical protein